MEKINFKDQKLKDKPRKSIVKNILIGSLLTILSGCSSPKNKVHDNHKENNPYQQSETDNRSKKDKKTALIVLSPHFDDAALSVGGIISTFDGLKYIVTFFSTPTTTKEYLTDWDKRCGFDKSTDAREAREKENINAAHILKANIINKDYVDNQYETRSPSYNTALIKAIAKDIETIIETTNDARVTVIGPSYFGENDTHPDHHIVSKAFMQAIRNKKYIDAKFYFYEDLPYTHHKFGEEEITLDKVLTDFYPGLHLEKRYIFISPEAFKSKIEAIKAYSSQINALHDGENKGIIEIIIDFGMNRCPQFPLPQTPCEVIYEIK